MTLLKKNWPPSRDEKPYREIVDIIHGTIPVPHPIDLIIDTPEFQRTRQIKQLGITFSVFPNCDHSRFVHSLGVFHLSRLFVHALVERSRKVVEITPSDELCVSIAGLCHDLGHGLLSHLFDRDFLTIANPSAKWRHEYGSVLIFDRICQYKWVREALLEYLQEEDFTFIRELIDPPAERFNANGEWNYRGRPLEKSFLYDIVSNSIDSLDVDKFDYLLRDSHHASIAISFNQNNVMRIMDWMRPIEVEERLPSGVLVRCSRICYAIKVLNDIDIVGQSRYALHERLYSHHTVRAYQAMILKALLSADQHLLFEGSDHKFYTLSQTVNNLDAFLKTNDSILQMIENSTSDKLEPARNILTDLKFRRIPKLIGSTILRRTDQSEEDEIKRGIYKYVDKNIVSMDDFIVCLRAFHRGMGIEKYPMTEVLFYDHKVQTEQPIPFRVDTTVFQHKSPIVGGSRNVMIYVVHDVSKKANKHMIVTALMNAFTKFALNERHEKPISAW